MEYSTVSFAIIPARGGSQRIKKKNVYSFEKNKFVFKKNI
jgi:CMP-N-acetylneuraminic acid synthetase